MADEDQLLEMRHPEVHLSDDIPSAKTTRAAFDEIWREKGWKLVGEAGPAAKPPAPPKKAAAKKAPAAKALVATAAEGGKA